MTATSEAVDLGRLLLDLLIVLAVARVGAELCERIHVPAVLGEIVAGVMVGPSVLGLVTLEQQRGVSLALIGELGVLMLLLQVGMEMDLTELGRLGAASMVVAVVGVAVPFVLGSVAGITLGYSSTTSVFLGAALTATSVGITARVFGDLRALTSTEARIVLGAAVADDVLGLVILTVVVKMVDGGGVDAGTIASTVALALAFLLVVGSFGVIVVPRLLHAVHRRTRSAATTTVAALVLTIGFAQLANTAKLAFIIGAFMAGIALGRSDHNERIAADVGVIGNIFIPVFFVQVGINTDLAAMAKPSVIGLAAVLFVVAVVGKLVSALGALGTPSDRLLVGIGMVPRGEVGLIFASIGRTAGVLGGDLYGALLAVILLTTLVTPPLLRLRIGVVGGRGRTSDPARTDEPTAEPAQGWVTLTAGTSMLNGNPPGSALVPIALQAATCAESARPSVELLEWFARHRDMPVRWSPDDTPALVRLLRAHRAHAWRLLEVTGVLERALPEIADAMQRRRADLGDLDPLGALRFPAAERLDDLAVQLGHPSDALVLAALAADVCRDESPPESCSIALLERLVEPDEARRIAALVTDAQLLRASARDPARFDERELLQLATHLGSAQRAHDAHHLALALAPMVGWQREALDQQQAMIREALDHPELTGSGANNLVAARRLAAQRLGVDAAAVERLRFAPNTYVLAHTAEELARQARLVEPLPRSGTVRVAVSPDPEPDHWKIDVACRDANALLARLTDVLTSRDLDIVEATIATWPDGAVLDTFTVRASQRPGARDLAHAFEAALHRPLRAPAATGLVAEFDNSALPWHTACDIVGPDQHGALLAISAAFARAKVVVHSARIATRDGLVHDRFMVSDRLDRKLDAEAMDRVQRALSGERIRRRVALAR